MSNKKENTGDCIFCSIIERKAEASIVYEDELAVAFMDIQPVNEGHVLIVPRMHAASHEALPEETAVHLMRVAGKINAALRSSGIPCEGLNYLLADGEAAGQEVFHIHLHVFPRYRNDGFGFRFSERYYRKTGRAELETVAAAIKTALHAE